MNKRNRRALVRYHYDRGSWNIEPWTKVNEIGTAAYVHPTQIIQLELLQA